MGFLPATRQSIVARRFAAGTDDDIGEGEDDAEMPKGALIGAGASGAEETIGIAGASAPGIWSGGSDSIRDGGESESDVSVWADPRRRLLASCHSLGTRGRSPPRRLVGIELRRKREGNELRR